jgi:hypothetical protein
MLSTEYAKKDLYLHKKNVGGPCFEQNLTDVLSDVLDNHRVQIFASVAFGQFQSLIRATERFLYGKM